MSLLAVRGLTIALPPGGDRADAVHAVNFAVEPGESLCMVGESGSGKSVSAAAIMGLLPPALRVAVGASLFEGVDLLQLVGDRVARAAWGADRHDLPGADDRAEPADAGGRADRRGAGESTAHEAVQRACRNCWRW